MRVPGGNSEARKVGKLDVWKPESVQARKFNSPTNGAPRLLHDIDLTALAYRNIVLRDRSIAASQRASAVLMTTTRVSRTAINEVVV